MGEQPIFKKEKMMYLGLDLFVYEFRGYYLTIVKQKINNEWKVMGATIENEETLKVLRNEVKEFTEEQNNTSEPFPVGEFITEMQRRNGSVVLFRTYGDFLRDLSDMTTNQNNIDIFQRMLIEQKFADRYLLNVVIGPGPLKDCYFDAEEALFLGDGIMKVIKNIKDKVYSKFVTTENDIDRMEFNDKDEHRMTIATGLQKEQPGRSSVLPKDLMNKIMKYGGKKKRKSLKKKRKSKRRKSLKKKQRKTKRKGRR